MEKEQWYLALSEACRPLGTAHAAHVAVTRALYTAFCAQLRAGSVGSVKLPVATAASNGVGLNVTGWLESGGEVGTREGWRSRV